MGNVILNRNVDEREVNFLEDYGDMHEYYFIYSITRDAFLNQKIQNTRDDAEPDFVWGDIDVRYHTVRKEDVVETLKRLNQRHNEVYSSMVLVPVSVLGDPLWDMNIPARDVMVL